MQQVNSAEEREAFAGMQETCDCSVRNTRGMSPVPMTVSRLSGRDGPGKWRPSRINSKRKETMFPSMARP